MIAPTSNPVRMQVAQLVENELTKIGIGTELDLMNWAALGPRCTDQEVGMYSEGGYDITFFGMSVIETYPATLKSIFGIDSIPPAGFNVGYWSPVPDQGYYTYRAQESEDLIAQISTSYNHTKSLECLHNWQKLWYDALPNILIYNHLKVHPISTGFYGYDPLSYPLDSIEDQWFIGDEDTVVLAVGTGPKSFNSMQATDVYSKYSATVPMDGLVGNTPSKKAVLPTGTDRDTWMTNKYGTTSYMALYPRMATSLGAFSDDGLQFNISVRDDIYWHDGDQFDAWDVAFSYQARLVPAIGASVYSNLLVPFGIDNKNAMSGNYSFVVEDKLPAGSPDGFFESISFQFQSTFAPWTTDYLGSLIYPEHILGDPTDHGFDTNGNFDVTKWNVQPGDWSSHSTSTGRTSDLGGYAGPVGTGPMIFKEYNGATGIITFEKFQNISWDGISWVENTDVNYYDLESIANMPQEAKIIVTDKNEALNKMKNREVNLLDPHYQMNDLIDEIRSEESIQSVYSPSSGWQGLWMNPKFNQDGVYHFQRKGVRHAISHMIPKSDIVKYLLDGLAQPAYTPISLTSRNIIPEQEMIQYKRSLLATDGTTPEIGSNTAYDDYNIDLALDWMETEGYDDDDCYWPGDSPTTTSSIPGFLIFLSIIVLLSLNIYISRVKYRKNL